MEILFCGVCLVVGFVVGALFYRNNVKKLQNTETVLREEIEDLKEKLK